MKKLVFAYVLSLSAVPAFAQNNRYSELVYKADSLYKAKDYKNCALRYSEAIRLNGGKGYEEDRYNAACCWSMAGYPDSAFYQLNYIATVMLDTMDAWTAGDPDLLPLHNDKRWLPVLELKKANREKAEAKLNIPLIKKLSGIFEADQEYRLQLQEMSTKFGWESQEMKDHIRIMNQTDSVNVIEVEKIIQQYGWQGADVIGWQGNLTLFFVIQHADSATQEKYLPVLREAVNKGNAEGAQLAYLEDRLSLKRGGKQIYGSQVGMDEKTKLNFVLPLEDPDNVDKRREKVGLQPIAEYLAYYSIKWDVEQYKLEQARREQQKK